MSWVIFVLGAAVWIILMGVVVRLCFIIEKIQEEAERKNTRTCSTCKHSDLSGLDEPCMSCINAEVRLPFWERDDS